MVYIVIWVILILRSLVIVYQLLYNLKKYIQIVKLTIYLLSYLSDIYFISF